MSYDAVTAAIQAEGLPLSEVELDRYIEKYPLQRAATERLYLIPETSLPSPFFSASMPHKERK